MMISDGFWQIGSLCASEWGTGEGGGGRGVYIGGAFVLLLSHFFAWEIIGIFEKPTRKL